ncbi:O-fucosyltransferase 16-like [Impatiens glandulifera]|uniref:O-fucosyltransferase 16-like n=1 Tax=Impatiens glandulifera TaxID=253017 RepID=UPI001FB06B18|nr:O-fucosyltransferase 16-like [Impatiens glandulifera]
MGVAAFPRRRHNHHHYRHRLRFLAQAISAISGVILLLIAFISITTPYPSENEHLHHPLQRESLKPGIENYGNQTSGVPKRRGQGQLDRHLWSSKLSNLYYGCSNASTMFPDAAVITQPNRYLLIATSGGLNQQRTGITDGVVAARILNATLVIPKLDQKSFWKDASIFSDIFSIEWFISSLSKDVKIIKQLPRRDGKIWTPYTMRVPRKCSVRCYQTRVLPNLLKKHAVQLNKFDYRLANRLDTDLQKLRCRVNYHALKFTDPILEMGKYLVHQMKMRSKHFIALHLRFEPDMLAFSGCYYGGGDKERQELGAIRKRWKTLHMSNPDKGRKQGRCPLTPEEVGVMLSALGYGKDVHIYVASGEVYGGEETLAPLKALFPNFHSKDTIASKEELDKFSGFSSRLAALDFIVCDESDVFVTNNNGNMAKILAGRRRYYGHKPTIRPNAKKLYRLFLNRGNMTWEEFTSGVRKRQRGFMGEPREVRPGRGEFHENPATCICEVSESNEEIESGSRKVGKINSVTRKEDEEVKTVVDDQNDTEEPELSDHDDDDDEQHQGDFLQDTDRLLINNTNLDYDGSASDEPELETMLSD